MGKSKGIWTVRDLAGILLVAIGLQLRLVETYEFSPQTTQLLSGWQLPPGESPRGALRQMVIETTQHRHRITPPAWLGWTCLSAGSVMLARRMMKK